ncbi:MAG: tyrosine-type recombinase/integrase [Gemmataceae bacterium]
MRSAEPWYRKQKDSWCVYHNGRLVTLARGKKNKRAANAKFKQLMQSGVEPTRIKIAKVCDLFLTYSKKHHAESTFEQNKYFLDSFCQSVGRVRVSDIKKHRLTEWLEKSGLGQTSQNKAIGTIKQAFNWALDQDHIGANPFASTKRPRALKRERILLPGERELIFKKIKGEGFKDFLETLEETGARPGELARVTAADIDFEKNVIILWKHKTVHKTGKPRLIFLTPKVKEICKRLTKIHSSGPIFRTIDGNKWTKDSLNCRFRRLRKKYPQLAGVTAYSFRHTWATNALERGVPLATVAELMGHSSTEMLERVYAHLNQKGTYLAEMAQKAIGV